MQKNPVVAVIPARFGSTRFPGKSLFLINGIPLLEHTYRRVKLCPYIDQCLIATDDERIVACAKSFGAEAIMTSPDCQTGTDRIAEVVKARKDLQNASIIVNVQGDEPCIDPVTISEVIQCLRNDPEASVGTAVTLIRTNEELQNPNAVKCVKSTKNRVMYFSRQPLPGCKKGIPLHGSARFFRHIGVYSFRPDFLLKFATLPPTPLQQIEDLEMLRAMEHGYIVAVAEVQNHFPDVNVPEDVKEVERWIESQPLFS